MPLDGDQWETAKQVSDNPTSGLQVTGVYEFLKEHNRKAYTIPEIMEETDVGSDASHGVKDQLKNIAVGGVKKQVVRYYTNKLVAKGHVNTRIRVEDGNEVIYYKFNGGGVN